MSCGAARRRRLAGRISGEPQEHLSRCNGVVLNKLLASAELVYFDQTRAAVSLKPDPSSTEFLAQASVTERPVVLPPV